MSQPPNVSSLALGRLSVYLRCLRRLQSLGVGRISSQEIARRFDLSAPQFRKDLAHFGEFGIRGVGYEVEPLRQRLEELFGLHRAHPTVIVGAGNIGTALARFPGFRSGTFQVMAIFDNQPELVGRRLEGLIVQHSRELKETVQRHQAEIGILAVPTEVAQENYDALVAAGVRGVLNFAPAQIRSHSEVRVRSVDLTVFLEELAYFIR